MKNKTKAGKKNTLKTAKAGSPPVRPAASGKKSDLSKAGKSQIEQSEPGKPKAIKSPSASSPTKPTKERISAKSEARGKAEGRASKPEKPKTVTSPNLASPTPPSKSDVSRESEIEGSAPEPVTPSVLDYQEQRARIARRAYELYEERCPPDADVQDWLRAERELMGKP